jgi:hypothetical protein
VNARTRSDVWMPLIQRLTEVAPQWAVWKNVDSALTGSGDIDSLAPPSYWPVIETEFRRWAASQGLGPAIACPHIPGGLNLVALERGSGFLFEVGVKERKAFRGSTLFHWADLIPFVEMDARGFRRIRPGAEGVLKLVLNGMRPGGGANWADLQAKNVVALLEADPVGASEAAELFGRGAGQIRRAVSAVTAGRWDRRAALAIEVRALARAVARPGLAAKRIRFKLAGTHSCPVVSALLGHARHVPSDVDAWLREVEQTHTPHEVGVGT